MSKVDDAREIVPPAADLSPAEPWIPQAVGLFAVLFAFWQLNSGHTEGWLVALGVASCALVVWLSRRIGVIDDEGVPLHLLRNAVTYWPWLAVEIVKANIDVARAILAGPSAIEPSLFRAPASQRTELGRVVYANSITLTPGTVTVDVAPDGMLTVHALTRAGREGVECGDMDRRVCRFMGES